MREHAQEAMSTSRDVRETVQAFLDDLATKLTRGDARGVAELWSVPAFVLGEAMQQVVSTRDEVEQFFAGAKDQYNQRGITDTRAEIIHLDELTDRICVATVRWPHLLADGEEVGGETSTYTLRRSDDGTWSLCIAVMHGVEEAH